MHGKAKSFSGNLSDVDLRLLRVFRVVVESGGFAGAEAVLGTGKSTVSKHIADLEQRLRLRLCNRGRSGFALTPEGEQVFLATRQLFASVEDFATRVNSISSRLVGTLSLGFVDTIITDERSPLLRAVTNFRRNAPEVHLRLSVGSTTEIEKGVADATLHIGVVVERGGSPALADRPLYSERSLLYCSKLHPLFAVPDEDISPAQIRRCAFVQRSYSENEATSALKGRLSAAATADHSEAVAMLILTGHYIGYLPQHYAADWVRRGDMRSVADDRMRYDTRMVAVTRSGGARTPLIERFLDELFHCVDG